MFLYLKCFWQGWGSLGGVVVQHEFSSVPHKPGMVAHSSNLSAWERWRQEDRKVNNAIVYIESKASHGSPTIQRSPALCLQLACRAELQAQGQEGRKLVLPGGKILNEQHPPPIQPHPSATQPHFHLECLPAGILIVRRLK